MSNTQIQFPGKPSKLCQSMIMGLAAVFTFACLMSDVSAQSQANPGATAAVKASAKAKIVGFRATSWKTIHSNSDQQATQTIATLKKLGCEVTSEDHGNHKDIRFRCPEWRSMKLDTNTLVSQWSMWCESQGLEVVVVNPVATTKKPTVAFRLPIARTVHLEDQGKAMKIVNTLTLIGCEVQTAKHDGHLDATFRCPEWTTIELATEESAHAWQKWLNESGFETKHTHVR